MYELRSELNWNGEKRIMPGVDAAADPAPSFQHQNAEAGVLEVRGQGQAGHASADDGYVHLLRHAQVDAVFLPKLQIQTRGLSGILR